MKKFLFFTAAIICSLFITASAANEVTVIIPDYECRIGNSSIYYYDSVYPFISYKDVTYFPMTYEYCHVLNLSISWDPGKGLYIAHQPDYSSIKQPPVYETTINSKYNKAVLPEYPIYINGKLISNTAEEYPVLNFRGVTYFPMTWDYAHEEFAWNTHWEEGLFTITTGIHPDTALSLERYLPDGFIVSARTDYDVELENGAHTIDTEVKYLKYSYETDELTEVEYDPNAEENKFKYTSAEVEIKNDVCYFGEQALTDILVMTKDYDDGQPEKVIMVDNLTGTEYTNKEKIASVENNISGRGYMLSGVQFYDFTNNYTIYYEKGHMSMGRPTFTYVEQNGKLIYIGRDVFAAEASICGDGNIYFNTCMQARTIRTRTSKRYELWRLTPDGIIEKVNDEFPDYNSMEILATINGTMYLRNTWFPETFSEDYYTVSAINDGYYSYAGKGQQLVKQANYVYADESIVSPDGKIYALIKWKEEIRKLN